MTIEKIKEQVREFVKEALERRFEIIAGYNSVDEPMTTEIEVGDLNGEQLHEIWAYLCDEFWEEDEIEVERRYGVLDGDGGGIEVELWKDLSLKKPLCEAFEYSDGKLKFEIGYRYYYTEWLYGEPIGLSEKRYKDIWSSKDFWAMTKEEFYNSMGGN
ncbi:hypothetical protein IKG33_02215 [Candidatus Saccharibacteria bacterium]|nr:hypothetical protein [Candidatus Saccharibacteria bacterium]